MFPERDGSSTRMWVVGLSVAWQTTGDAARFHDSRVSGTGEAMSDESGKPNARRMIADLCAPRNVAQLFERVRFDVARGVDPFESDIALLFQLGQAAKRFNIVSNILCLLLSGVVAFWWARDDTGRISSLWTLVIAFGVAELVLWNIARRLVGPLYLHILLKHELRK